MTDRVHALLYRPRRIDAMIGRINAKIEARKSSLDLHGISYDGVKVQTSPHDKIADTIAEIDELERKRDQLIVMRDEAIEDVERSVMQLKDDAERTVLYMQYASGNRIRFGDIADTLHYSYRQTDRIRLQALQHLDEMMSEMSV